MRVPQITCYIIYIIILLAGQTCHIFESKKWVDPQRDGTGRVDPQKPSTSAGQCSKATAFPFSAEDNRLCILDFAPTTRKLV